MKTTWAKVNYVQDKINWAKRLHFEIEHLKLCLDNLDKMKLCTVSMGKKAWSESSKEPVKEIIFDVDVTAENRASLRQILQSRHDQFTEAMKRALAETEIKFEG